jgi:hypothetical protein
LTTYLLSAGSSRTGFNQFLAQLIGLREAIVLSQVYYRMKKYSHVIYGKQWAYNSYAGWQTNHLPFLSVGAIRRTILSLESQGILIGKQLSSDKRDRTKWYTINYKSLEAKHDAKKEWVF